MGADEMHARCEATFAVQWPSARFVWTETRLREGSGRYPATLIGGRAQLAHGVVTATVVPLLNTRSAPQASRWYDTVRPALHLSTAPGGDGATEVSIRFSTRRFLHAWIVAAFSLLALGVALLVLGGVLRIPAGVVGGAILSLLGIAFIAMIAAAAPEAEVGYQVLSGWLDEVIGPHSAG